MRTQALGELLIEAKVINEDTLKKALELQKKSGKKIGQVLVSMGALSEDELLKFLSIQSHIPYIDLLFYDLDPSTITLLPEVHARKYGAIILKNQEKSLLVGMVDPFDLNAIDALSKFLQRSITPAYINEHVLTTIIDRIYRRTSEISHFATELSHEIGSDTLKSMDNLFDESP